MIKHPISILWLAACIYGVAFWVVLLEQELRAELARQKRGR